MTAIIIDVVAPRTPGRPREVRAVAWSAPTTEAFVSHDVRAFGELDIGRVEVATFDGADLAALGTPITEQIERVLDLRVELRVASGARVRIDSYEQASCLLGLDPFDGVLRDAVGADPHARAEECREAARAGLRVSAAVRQRVCPVSRPGQVRLRGAYALECGAMEQRGIPLDVELVQRINARLPWIRRAALDDLGADRTLFVGGRLSPSAIRAWSGRTGTEWPRDAAGRYLTERQALDAVAASSPALQSVVSAMTVREHLRRIELPVGPDRRARAPLRPLAAFTGRNAPSSKGFVFGLPRWTRRLIVPAHGTALAYLDVQAEDIGVAAGLSRDPAMMTAYATGDPYGGRLGTDRETRKAVSLAVLYGQGATALAVRLGISLHTAEQILRHHRRTHRALWKWFDRVILTARAEGRLSTPLGWVGHFDDTVTAPQIRAFPVQGAGADVLRWAVVAMARAGVAVLAPVHDAVLVEAPARDIEEAACVAERAFVEASRLVLDGFSLRVCTTFIRSPTDWPLSGRALSTWTAIERALASGGGAEVSP